MTLNATTTRAVTAAQRGDLAWFMATSMRVKSTSISTQTRAQTSAQTNAQRSDAAHGRMARAPALHPR